MTEKVFSLGVSSGVGVNDSHADFAKSVSFFFFLLCLYEPPHDKTNKVTVRPEKTQIRLSSLIRVFAVCSMGS